MSDLKNLEIEDLQVRPKDWSLMSLNDPKVNYKIISKQPLEYFDLKKRYLVKNNEKTYYGYFAIFNQCSGALQDDILADFWYLQSLQARFQGKLKVFDDICIEQTDYELRMVCIEQKTDGLDIENCIVNKTDELIEQG